MITMDQLVSRRQSDPPGWDRGRKLLSVAKLSGGGALIVSSLVNLIASVVGKNISDTAEIVFAILGGAATFAALTAAFHIFDNRRA